MGSRGLLAGQPIGRVTGSEAMKLGWQRLNEEYAKEFRAWTAKEPDL